MRAVLFTSILIHCLVALMVLFAAASTGEKRDASSFLCYFSPLLCSSTADTSVRKYEENFNYGPVVIIMSRGRSGSVYITRILENLAGAKHAILSDGILGKGLEYMMETRNPKKIILEYLQDLRIKNFEKKKYDNVIGFKWKPFIWNDEFDEALDWCAQQGFRFVFNYRNPLDVFISLTKHHAGILVPHEYAHCFDKDCVSETQSIHVRLDPQETIEFIRNETESVELVREKFRKYNVKYIEIKYEEYVYGSMESRVANLERIAEFAVPKKYKRPARAEDLDTGMMQTTNPHQNITVLNYDEVAEALNKAGMGNFLFP